MVLGLTTAATHSYRRLYFSRRWLVARGTAEWDITITIHYARSTRNGGVSLLRRTCPRRIVGFRISGPETTTFRGSRRPPPTARTMCGEWPGEFRTPRRA